MNKPRVHDNKKVGSCVIGIDFGTTNSAMSQFLDTMLVRGPESLNFPLTGSVLYPSVAYLDDAASRIRTGHAAYKKRHLEPDKVVLSVKRKITDKIKHYLNRQEYTNFDIAKTIIRDFIAEIIQTDHDFHPDFAVVTVPYYFGENENVKIKLAAEEAIEELTSCTPVISVIPEPVAASLACIYSLGNRNLDSDVFLIYDIGGGTLDLTLVKVTINSDKFSFEVLANDGISKFGGDDIDYLIYDYVRGSVNIDESNLTEHHKRLNKARLLKECNEAKHLLSFSQECTLVCVDIFGAEGGFVEFVLTREILDSLLTGNRGSTRNMVGELQNCMESLYAKSGISSSCVKYIVPVGGTSFVPIFRSCVKNAHLRAQEVMSDNFTENLTLVARGASIYAAMKSDEISGTGFHPFGDCDSVENIQTRISHSLYIEKYNGKLDQIVPANSVSPIQVKKRYFPAKLRADRQTVELAQVRLFQGEGLSRRRGSYIGEIDFSKYSIYTHGRSIDKIPIDITIEATDTFVKAHCFVPQASHNGTDLEFTQIVHE